MAAISVAPVAFAYRPTFYREQHSRMYRVIYYELAVTIVEVTIGLTSAEVFVYILA